MKKEIVKQEHNENVGGAVDEEYKIDAFLEKIVL